MGHKVLNYDFVFIVDGWFVTQAAIALQQTIQLKLNACTQTPMDLCGLCYAKSFENRTM
jgi:hypothetical protein